MSELVASTAVEVVASVTVVVIVVASKSGGPYATSRLYRTCISSLISTRWYLVSLARFETVILYSTSSRRTALIADEKKRVCYTRIVECFSIEI